MKKRIISLILASIMLLSITSCGKKNTNYAEMTLEEYIDKVELPKNLTISIDPATVEERETVNIYENVEFMEFDDEIVRELLLRNPVTEENISAMGRQYVSETDTQVEYLNIYDGGEAYFGENGQGPDGGVNYTWKPDKESSSAVERYAQERYPQVYTYSMVSDSLQGLFDRADQTLDFASREDIASRAISFFTEIGFPQTEVHEIVAYDTEALASQCEEASQIVKPQKSDECYVVLCRQLIDDIPITTYHLTDLGGDSPWLPQVNMQLTYTENGIVMTSMYNLLEQPETSNGIQTNIIDAISALELVKEYYGKAILSKQHTIEEMELTYIEFDGVDDKTVTLRPYWLVKVSYQQEFSETDPFTETQWEGELKAYDHLYFDAVTGELCEGSTSGKKF